MPTENNYDRILAYLKGLLSHRQRHNLEKDMMQDVFDEEAFEGLSGFTGSDLESDMERLQKRLDARIVAVKKKQWPLYFRIAAAMAILIGVGSLLFFIFHTPGADLLTEDHKIEKPVVRNVPPLVSVQPLQAEEEPDKSLQEKKTDTRRQAVQAPTEDLTESDEESYTEPAAVPEKKESGEPDVSAAREATAQNENDAAIKSVTLNKSAAAKAATSPGALKKSKVIANSKMVYSGTVVDNSGEGLPGVTVMETGTSNGTFSDVNGNFSLPLHDTNSHLTLSFIGFRPVELEATGKPRDKIVMQEDMVALNEVVVVGYGTQKRNNITGSVSTVRVDDESMPRQSDQPVITKPVPPGGSLKAFKKWVNDRLNYPAFKEFPGKHKINVEITVHANGTISNIRVNQNAPEVIAADLKRIISQSSRWTAGLKDNNPVDTDIVIRFVVTVE